MFWNYMLVFYSREVIAIKIIAVLLRVYQETTLEKRYSKRSRSKIKTFINTIAQKNNIN